MNKLFTIAITELKLFFYTSIAYIIAFSFYCVNGILFWYLINKANIPGEHIDGSIITNMTGGIIAWLSFLIIVPVITMKLLAYEAENKRLSHLFSTPVRNWQITCGKFIGCVCFCVVIWIETHR